MALNLSPIISLHPTPFLIPKHKHLLKLCRISAQSGGREGGVTEEDPSALSSARSQLDLLDQLTSTTPSSVQGTGGGYESDGMWEKVSIRDQLAQLVGEREGDFMIPLGPKRLKKVSPKFLTISQKRNIRRQAYLNEVSQRNDSVFFATIGAFVILPPIIILTIAIITGYVQLFP